MANDQENSESAEMCLQMSCWSEELSDAQQAYYSRTEREYNDIMKKISDFMSKEGGTIIEQGSDVLVVQASSGPPAVSVRSNLVTPVSQAHSGNQKSCFLSLTPSPSPACSSLQTVPKQTPVLQASVNIGGRAVPVSQTAPGQSTGPFQTPQTTIQLVVDPRLGLIATLPSQQAIVNPVIQAGPVTSTAVTPATITIQPKSILSMTKPSEPIKKRPSILAHTTRSTSVATTPSPQTKVSVPVSTTSASTSSTPTSTVSLQKTSRSKVVSSDTVPKVLTNNRPSESNSIGGICAGNVQKRNVQDEVKSNATGPDSREVSFNKLSGKTFPSLVVLARPHLRPKDMSNTKLNQERSQLDSKVKCVLMYMATKFTEWLLQQGLIKGDQYCNMHFGPDGFQKLKLGMYSDVTKFPYSGGYMWVNDCCPQRFVSVFNGSIFEGAPHPPSILLKLIYHWCCQTNVQNVIQWVKVDNFYVKNFFTHMRSVCIAAVHQKHEKLGGPLRRVEVGVISLGTTSQDGNQRQVKVEVLGVMDVDSKLVRLRAVEPLQDGERNYKRRFVKILEPLKQWLHPDSIILTDFTVDKGTLLNMGFSQVYQSTIPDPPSTANKNGNQNVMEYLRRIVPRMFQNTLSLLSRQIIQQFLDELVWRERWGPTPAQAFDSIISHLASQTKLDSGEPLLTKLSKIAANPFRNWEYQYWKCDGISFPEPLMESSPPLPPQPPSTVAPAVTTAITTNSAISETAGTGVDIEICPSIATTKRYEFKLDEDQKNRLTEALERLDKGMSVRKAAITFKLPRSVLLVKAKSIPKDKPPTNQSPLSEDEEKDIKDHLMTLYDWGYPFGRYDIRLIVKNFLDTAGRTEITFKDNFPPDMWIERYLSRHPAIRHRLCRNIPSRGNFIEPESVKQYVMSLSTALHGVPPENILNFMEISLTGDPLKSMSLELRELRYPVGKRKVKSAASIMIACTALGKVLPSYVIFEGSYRGVTMTTGHFPGEYHATKSGWFDEAAFEKWLETVVVPWSDKVVGKKVIVGDNLAQLFTVTSLALCKDKDISFVSMPCNVTGVLSPLDVALCEKLRSQWKAQTREWASKHSDRFIGVDEFPHHINELLKTTLGGNIQDLIRKAFKITGLYPYSSKNTMKALDNGGVSLDEQQAQEKQGDGKKRKRIFLGTDNIPVPTKETLQSSIIEEVILDDDVEKEVQDMENALQSGLDLIPLDPYYYGTKLPVKEFVQSEYKVENLNAKCPYCQMNVPDNLTLMRHLFSHSKKPSSDVISNIHLCKYCASKQSSQDDLDKHVKEMHKGLESRNNACLICSERMRSRAELILHMHKTHTKRELPYICTICFYRSSEHYKLIDHFYEVHANGEKLQCPCCLKCIAVSNMGKKSPANISFFMHHFEKHFSEARFKCEKCALWFVHKGLMRQHQTKEHSSCLEDVVPYVLDEVMMPAPTSDSHIEIVQSVQLKGSASLGLNKIKSPNLLESLVCIECGFKFSEEIHFLDQLSCPKCCFVTYCAVSMQKHKDSFHGSSRSTNSPRPSKVIALPQEMFCICGFRTRFGNSLSCHLVRCNKRRAFCSAASANIAAISQQTANFPPLVSLDESSDPHEEFVKAFSGNKVRPNSNGDTAQLRDPASILNSVGLVKKKSIEENGEKFEETEDKLMKDCPTSRVSNTGSISLKRKRATDDSEAELVPSKKPESEVILAVTMPKGTKEVQRSSQMEVGHTSETQNNSVSTTTRVKS